MFSPNRGKYFSKYQSPIFPIFSAQRLIAKPTLFRFYDSFGNHRQVFFFELKEKGCFLLRIHTK